MVSVGEREKSHRNTTSSLLFLSDQAVSTGSLHAAVAAATTRVYDWLPPHTILFPLFLSDQAVDVLPYASAPSTARPTLAALYFFVFAGERAITSAPSVKEER